jgi:hypothetical protein
MINVWNCKRTKRRVNKQILTCSSALFFMISYKNIACVKKPDGKIN